MAINRTGFEQTNYGLEIAKDPQAQLVYTFDWSEWLDTGDAIAIAEYTVEARRNDPTPIVIEDSGVANSTQTYVELSGGQHQKTYIVTVKVTTGNALVDRRQFRVNCVNRQA